MAALSVSPFKSEARTCKSRTSARRSPWLVVARASMAASSKGMPSSRSTRRAMRRSASSLARTKLILRRWRVNRSLVLRHEEFRPHNPISSLQARITGCLVWSRSRSSSAFPPESPERVAPGRSSSPDMARSMRSWLTCRNPPERWSTSSKRMSVLEGGADGS